MIYSLFALFLLSISRTTSFFLLIQKRYDCLWVSRKLWKYMRSPVIKKRIDFHKKIYTLL